MKLVVQNTNMDPINYRAGYAAEVGEHGFKLQTIYHIDNYRV